MVISKIFPLFVLSGTMVLFGCNSTEKNEQVVENDNTSTKIEQTLPQSIPSEWVGVYKGLIPCDDCAGVNLFLELLPQNGYSLSRSYVDKMSISVMEEGTVVYEQGSRVIKVADMSFFVAENQLILVDESHNRVIGDNVDFYSLEKQ
ncbi:copper resistance protein NlpE N-terminal domain-containing protein [Vibrio vulnificus]|nr:copper resistance protein NlpE N-terminal domain-containing protein [Vibrio vulnificus]ELR8772618.1 copper resistance protein NlpE N-terminal domain-containing protein [Vibrio vulnificus]ELV8636047.1 copper resistance protein NlpE N-terminal domain-containing protein [Vibrio vulnificus]